MNAWLDDLRHAARRLRREPWLTMTAIVTLGLGIGVNAALLAVARDALFVAPPVAAPEDLRVLRPRITPEAGAARESPVWSYPMFETLRQSLAQSEAAVEVAAYTPRPRRTNFGAVTRRGPLARQLALEMVSASYFDVLGVRPVLGRGFVAADDAAAGGQAVVLLGYDTWRGAFDGDPGIVGQKVSIERLPFEVVGVLPQGFAGLSEGAEAWVPMASAPALTFSRRLTGQLSFWHSVVTRSRPASQAADAAGAERVVADAAALERAARAIAEAIPLHEAFGPGRLDLHARPLLAARRDPALEKTLALLALVGAAVLVVAAINVAHLVLTRVSARQSEFAVRRALGASWADAWRRHVAEAFWLGAGSLAAGLALVPAIVAGVARFRPALESLRDSTIDAWLVGSVIALTLALVLALAGLGYLGERALFRAAGSLGGGGGARFAATGAAREAGGARLRAAFVVTQLALVLMTALTAAATARGLARLYDRPLGFDPASTLTLRVSLPRNGYEGVAALAFFTQARERLAALPGVQVASFANCLPLTGECDHVKVRLERDLGNGTASGEGEDRAARLNLIDPDYPRALGLAIRAGRGFTAADREGTAPVVLIDRSAVRRWWPDLESEAAAVGQRLAVGVGFPQNGFAEVVGVVEDVPGSDLLNPASSGVYLALAQFRYNSGFFVLRFAGSGEGLAAAATQAIHQIDPDLAVFNVATFDERLHRTGASIRFGAVLLSGLGGLATILAGLGVYAVMAFAVGRRRRELAVRMAFGARPSEMVRGVLRNGLRLAGVGVAVGGALSLALDRVLMSRLEGAVPMGLDLFLVTAAWVAALAILACWVPARRAAAIDPAQALRAE